MNRLSELFNQVFDLSSYQRATDVVRARIVYSMLSVLLVLFTSYAFVVPFRTQQQLDAYYTYFYRALRPVAYPLYAFGFVAFYVIALLTYRALRRGHLVRSLFGPPAMIYLGAVIVTAQNNLAYSQNFAILLLPLLTAALLYGERGLQLFTPLHFVVLLTSYGYYLGRSEDNSVPNLIILLIGSFISIFFLYLYLRLNRLDRTETEILANKRRLQIAQLTTRITRGIAESKDLHAVLADIVHEISEAFPEAYHVQVFLVDESGRIARLVASTGEPGRKLLERQHSLPVGSISVIGQATQRQQAIRVEVGGENSVHRPNDLLPETRLEVAFPLNIRSRNIGALDLQAKSADVLLDEDLVALQSIADSIAIAVDNARLIEQTQQRLQENQYLVERMTATQRDIEVLNRELTGMVWADYLRDQEGQFNFDLNFEEGHIESSKEFTEAIMEAVERGDVVRRFENGQHIVAVPLRVRGEVIGAIEFEVENDLTGADIDMLREVGERFGLSAENNRLFRDSQRLAQREALVNQISTRIQGANTVDNTLSEAARSLRDALKASRVDIRLGQPPTTRR